MSPSSILPTHRDTMIANSSNSPDFVTPSPVLHTRFLRPCGQAQTAVLISIIAWVIMPFPLPAAVYFPLTDAQGMPAASTGWSETAYWMSPATAAPAGNKVSLKVTNNAAVVEVGGKGILVERDVVKFEATALPLAGWSIKSIKFIGTNQNGVINDPKATFTVDFRQEPQPSTLLIGVKFQKDEDDPGESMPKEEYVAAYVSVADLDTDSDNNSYSNRSHGEDLDEAPAPGGPALGKLVVYSPNTDLDQDGVPDFADFDGTSALGGASSRWFPGMSLFLDGLPSGCKVRLVYAGSDPAAIQKTTTNGVTTYTAAAGYLRVWTKNAPEVRKPTDILTGGHYLTPNVAYTLSQLNQYARRSDLGLNHFTLYIEPIRPSAQTADQTVEVQLLFPGTTAWVPLDKVSITLLSARLLIDMDRNGVLDDTDLNKNRPNMPYRFWINDDMDRGHTVDDSDWEEDDIGGGEQIGNRADSAEDRIQSKRDLEDYARLWIQTQGLNASFKDDASPLCLGLQWTDTGGTTPAIKIVKHVETDGGTKYLTDEGIAHQQITGSAAAAIQWVTNTYPDLTLIDASDTNGRFFVFPKSLFSGLSETTPKTYMLFEGLQVGKGQLRLVILKKENGSYTKIGDGPGVWIDLKKIEDFYERWTVGDTNGGDPWASAALQKATFGADGNLTSYNPYSPGFAYPATAPEEKKYILYVHGWNMQPWEKNRFAETMFKRLYWQGYKGRFGVFCWPTTYSFEPPASAILDSTNYDRGEWAAWKSATPLKSLLGSLNGTYSGKVYVMAHSMGNVVTGEALRLASQQATGQIVNTYVASQAAVPAHCYDGGRAEDLAVVFDFATSIGRAFDGSTFPQTPNVYPDWLAGNGAAAARRVNFYNDSDYALWHDVWELNQYFKPDREPHEYTYLDDIAQPPTPTGFGWLRTDGTVDQTDRILWSADHSHYWRVAVLNLGSAANVQDRYEIMAYAAESRSKAVGAVAGSLTLNESVDLQTIWPADDQSVKLHSGLNYSAHKWHSAQFRSTNMRQKGYWAELLGIHGFNLSPTTP